jgi:hypothetical protein
MKGVVLSHDPSRISDGVILWVHYIMNKVKGETAALRSLPMHFYLEVVQVELASQAKRQELYTASIHQIKADLDPSG